MLKYIITMSITFVYYYHYIMKIRISDDCKKTNNVVVFIHGFGKNSETFNISEFGKELNIEKTIRTIAQTVLIDIEENDYLLTVPDVANTIYDKIKQFKNIWIVAHSYGCFYAIQLAEQYHNIVKGIILLEPTVKSDQYKIYLENLPKSPVNDAKLKNFDSLPNGSNIKNKTIVQVHLSITQWVNLSTSISNVDEFESKIDKIKRWTNANVISEIVIYPSKSHMIHYDCPLKIIHKIRQLIV
jgi:predicted alpha/beta hydrolase family esterase